MLQYNKQIMALAAAPGTQTRARLRHYCTRVCAPYLEVMHYRVFLKGIFVFNAD